MASMVSEPCWANALEGDVELERTELPGIGGALLMELLEEPRSDGDEAEDDRLRCVIRSLEAEIGTGPEAIGGGVVEPEDTGMEDILSDLDRYGWSAYRADQEGQLFDWVELMEVAAGGDMGDWYMDAGGRDGVEMVGYGDLRGYPSFYYNGDTSSMEQEYYSPLWE